MTDGQRQQIIQMRKEGCGYTFIAKKLDISRDTVRSFCRRNSLAGVRSGKAVNPDKQQKGGNCRECEKELQRKGGNCRECEKELQRKDGNCRECEEELQQKGGNCRECKKELQQKGGNCRECKKELQQTEGIKKKVFCCRKCREKWWHEHPDQIRQRAVYSFVCAGCGKGFTAYGNSHRKYCSHKCYISSRFKGGDDRG